MMAMHCTQKSPLEKILGLHYRGFEILTLVFTRPCDMLPSKNWQFSRSVEKVRLEKILHDREGLVYITSPRPLASIVIRASRVIGGLKQG
jgi:hypothetical protein